MVNGRDTDHRSKRFIVGSAAAEQHINTIKHLELLSFKAMARFAFFFSLLLFGCFLPRATQSFSVSPAEAWDSYNAALAAHPLAVKSVTASVILGAADLSGQAIEASQTENDETSSIDWARAARFSIFGLVLQAVGLSRASFCSTLYIRFPSRPCH